MAQTRTKTEVTSQAVNGASGRRDRDTALQLLSSNVSCLLV